MNHRINCHHFRRALNSLRFSLHFTVKPYLGLWAVLALSLALPTPTLSADDLSATPPTAPPASTSAEKPPYTVVEGNKVDPNTLEGWHTWRAMACERCHGAQQQGSVGPSLIDGLKRLTKEQFEQTVLNGRPGTLMPSFMGAKSVTEHIDDLYAYLKGRSDGAISPGHLNAVQK